MIILKVLYYLFPVAFIVANFIILSATKKYLELGRDVYLNTKKEENEKDESLVGRSCLLGAYAIILFIWNISALFTYNYEFVLLMLPTSILIGKIFFRKGAGASFGNMVYAKFWSVVNMVYYTFLIINTFHLHIQLGLFDFIKGLF